MLLTVQKLHRYLAHGKDDRLKILDYLITYIYIYRVSRKECARLRENVP